AGWLDAWVAAPSAYAVAAESADDVVAAVSFAREHHLRLVIKGTGHDYLGRSNAPDSLLIWTHKMREVTVHDAFVARGCPGGQAGIPAVTVGAGTRWVEAYQEVTVRHGRYVQGGGCTTVGAAGGFTQGGGFGSWSKKYGTAAAGMLEAEVVTADGRFLVANACQNRDLFWALRGGGGGTFGVVTRMTLMTHPLPKTFGWADGTITAKTDAAFKELIERFLRFYRESMSNEHWGEQVAFQRNNSLRVGLVFEGLSAEEAKAVWKPLLDWVAQRPESFAGSVGFGAVPADKMWNYDFLKEFPDAVEADRRPGEPGDRFWWKSDEDQVSTYWYSFQSRWIPLDRFEGAEATRFAASLFEASRHWSVVFHFNKGQAGASEDAVRRGRETSVNPAVYRAAALVIVAASGEGSPGVKGREPDLAEARAARDRVSAAMRIIRDATPGAGSYVNETDYFEPDWQRTFWGENYPKLLDIKRKYDPQKLFSCHHCVGSEEAPAR
ncbi:MAG TPA: FAD-binding protein, partial [Haliangiales bacterium]|nr:FAD-binding protein [Haliangiales bacterium]